MTITEAEKKYNVTISIIPEHYPDGTNWNWQILWYDEQNELDGTFQFGDNHEHPTQENAETAALEYLVTLREKGNKEALANYRKTYYKNDSN